MLPCITYTTLAIDLGLHGSWQKKFLQRFESQIKILPNTVKSKYNRNVAYKNFANYREVQDLSPMMQLNSVAI